MAKFWENLKRHEDNIEKHKITDEEIQFLKKLQHEMNTQDTVCQANPRYWVIRDYKKVCEKELNNPDGIIIYDSDSCFTVAEIEYQFLATDNIVNEILEAFKKHEYELGEEEIENIKLAYDMDSLIEYLEEIETYDFEIMQYEDIPVDSGMFLTHEAAIEHLRRNDYHYCDKAHTYAKTAWRSTEEKLWDILQTVDFDKLR